MKHKLLKPHSTHEFIPHTNIRKSSLPEEIEAAVAYAKFRSRDGYRYQ